MQQEFCMNLNLKKNFIKKWELYFPGSELPIACYYTDEIDPW